MYQLLIYLSVHRFKHNNKKTISKNKSWICQLSYCLKWKLQFLFYWLSYLSKLHSILLVSRKYIKCFSSLLGSYLDRCNKQTFKVTLKRNTEINILPIYKINDFNRNLILPLSCTKEYLLRKQKYGDISVEFLRADPIYKAIWQKMAFLLVFQLSIAVQEFQSLIW